MMRAMILSLVGCTALIAAAGCSAEVPTDDEAVMASAGEEAIQPKGVWTTCAGTSAATHHTATELVRYVFGAPAPTFPAGAACDQVKAALTDLRDGLNNGTQITISHTNFAICGINSSVVVFAQNNTSALVKTVAERIDANTDACFGPGVRQYLAPFTGFGPGNAAQIWMDPEPATLTADLSSTQGAAAAAYWSTSLDPTVAKKWNATYGACGSAVGAAEPCSTTALSSGQQATRLIQKNGTLCRCL